MNREQFTHLCKQPFIQQIAYNPRWTLSENKRPLNIRKILDHPQSIGEHLPGATTYDNESLVTLPELYRAFMTPPNITYYLNNAFDDILVVDIEPHCPDDLKQELLQIPHLYAETSTSGKGIHLIVPKPDNFYDYPNAIEKTSLQFTEPLEDKNIKPKVWYEILIRHFVSFTGNQLHLPQGNKSFEEVYATLAKDAKHISKGEVSSDVDLKPEDIIDGEWLVDNLVGIVPKKDMDDYPSRSHYDFAVIGTIRNHLKKLFQTMKIKMNGHEYTEEEIISIVYHAVYETLPYREKYDTYRNGLPYLMYAIVNQIALDKGSEK